MAETVQAKLLQKPSAECMFSTPFCRLPHFHCDCKQITADTSPKCPHETLTGGMQHCYLSQPYNQRLRDRKFLQPGRKIRVVISYDTESIMIMFLVPDRGSFVLNHVLGLRYRIETPSQALVALGPDTVSDFLIQDYFAVAQP